MAKVIALGEVLIDFTPCGRSERGRMIYECNPGGAPANMLSCLAQFGHDCRMIGCVGKDAFGDEIVGAIADAGVDCRYISRSDAPTTLAVVSLNADGDRSFSFYRDHCADVSIAPQDITEDMMESTALVHVGSLSLTHEPARSATHRLLELAKENGVAISYDPNYRPLLWKSAEQAKEGMASILPLADIVKVSDEEAVFLTGMDDLDAAAQEILAQNGNIRVLFLTKGAEGSACYLPGGEKREVAGLSGAQIVDTTGAGDYFFGGAVSRLLEEGMEKAISPQTAEEACRRGNECGYRVAQVRGALGVKIK